MENNISAIVLGATGLVGSQLLQLLVEDDRFEKILVVGRTQLPSVHPKIDQLIVNFDNPDEWRSKVQGDFLFSAFGTTIKKAGSQDKQYKIDYTYQWSVAQAAAENGASTYVLISSIGANAKSSIFYNRIKGELDRDVKKFSFKNINILKPSLLVGDRKEHRAGEKFATFFGKVLKYVPVLKKYRPINDIVVAKAMINTSLEYKGHQEWIADELFVLAKQ